MKMTDGERLIIVMLAEVMEALKLNREIDPKLVKSLACNNDGWAIAEKYSGIFDCDAPSKELVDETRDILWMWDIIEYQIEQLTGDDAEEAKGFRWNKFNGFDGNRDPHIGIARTFIQKLGSFPTFKDRDLNSHSPLSLTRYQDMSVKFDHYLNNGGVTPLTMDMLRDLCN